MNPHRSELDPLEAALARLRGGFERLPEADTPPLDDAMAAPLHAAADRLRDNYPYHHPLYVGQMLKPPHPVARLAYAMAMTLNPNNHALDGGRASSAMEKEAVADIGRMFGWDACLGHLTGGGTMANFEALWVARELGRETGGGRTPAVAASTQAHYTHSRLSAVLDVPFVRIAADASGRLDVSDLRAALERGDAGTGPAIGAVVATLGTTAAGAVDPLADILALRERRAADGRPPLRIHVDTAYGGYFTLADNLAPAARAHYDRIAAADSIVIDPHKHGLQPYGCGCVLFRDPSVGRFYRHDSPYTYFSSPELHLGEISLECSRAGAAAVALWTTMRAMPLVRGGTFAAGLESGRRAALAWHAALAADARFAPLVEPELDIVTWAVRAPGAAEASDRARAIFDAAARHDLHLAVATFPRAMAERAAPVERWDTDTIACLRACVMKPEHEAWLPEIRARLDRAARDVLG
jgi:tyrosine decarboxylase/aspartate 1-decarboxylase